MNRTRSLCCFAAAVALTVAAGCAADAGGTRSAMPTAASAGSEFRRESIEIKSWKVCESFDIDKLAEHMDYEEYGTRGKMEGGYAPGQIVSHYGRCQAFVTYGRHPDSRGRATETGGSLLVGLYPSESQAAVEASYREYQDLVARSYHDDVEVVEEREINGDWDAGGLIISEDGVGATRINILLRDQGFVLELDVEYEKDKGLEHARKKGLDVAEWRHLPFDHHDDLVQWLLSTYLPEAHATVLTRLAAS